MLLLLSKTFFKLSILTYLVNPCSSKNFSKIPYCKMRCTGGDHVLHEHLACKCTSALPGRKLITTDLNEFREAVVDKHNQWRNQIASGKLNKISEASNMEVLSYDLEMEHIANCHAKKFERADNKPYCVMASHSSRSYVLFAKAKNMTQYGDPMKTTFAIMENWFNQHKNLAEKESGSTVDLKSVTTYEKLKIAYEFINLLWADLKYVGCARLSYPSNKNTFQRYVVVCNYGGSDLGPSLDQVPYRIGPPCSKCPYMVKCNSKYRFLCGEIKGWEASPHGAEGTTKKPSEAALAGAEIKLTILIQTRSLCNYVFRCGDEFQGAKRSLDEVCQFVQSSDFTASLNILAAISKT